MHSKVREKILWRLAMTFPHWVGKVRADDAFGLGTRLAQVFPAYGFF